LPPKKECLSRKAKNEIPVLTVLENEREVCEEEGLSMLQDEMHQT
jgi:hypothetical protein